MGGIKISSSGNQSKRIGFSPALLLSFVYFILFHYHFRRGKRINAKNSFVFSGYLRNFQNGGEISIRQNA